MLLVISASLLSNIELFLVLLCGLLLQSNAVSGAQRLDLLDAVQRQAANGTPYLPLWLVRPRAWALNSITAPEFDGSGRLIFGALQRREQP